MEPRADPDSVAISVVIPAVDEAPRLPAAIESARGDGVEVVVVDGGSADRTPAVAAEHGARVLAAPRGRGRQMNAGAAAARGDTLLFLHADSRLPIGWPTAARTTLAAAGVAAGAFRLAIDGGGIALRLIEAGVAWRSRWLSLPYGDQALFLRRTTFERLGGFADLPIMEDVDLVCRLRRQGRIALADLAVTTSARSWRRRGTWLTTVRHQALLAAWWCGVSPARLARW